MFILTYKDEDALLFHNSQHWSPHYDRSKKNTVVCFRNNKTIAYFRKFYVWFKEHVENFENMYQYLQPLYPSKRETPIPLAELEGVNLREFQRTSVLLMLTYSKFCLFYGTGTGKTYMSLSYFHSVAQVRVVRGLVVTKAKLVDQYARDAEGKIPYFDIYTDIEEFVEAGNTNKNVCTLLVTSYAKMPRVNIPWLTDFIMDESHECKSFSSRNNREASRIALNIPNVYEFTGTPKDSHNYEKFAQFKILYPELVPSKTAFMYRYYVLDDFGKPRRYDSIRHEDELEEVIYSISFGGDTEDLLESELPPMNEYKVDCRLPDKEFYKQFSRDRIYHFNDREKIVADTKGKLRIRQRQICCGFVNGYRTEFDSEGVPFENLYLQHLPNPKEIPLKQLIHDMDTGIIFVQFKQDVINVSKYLRDMSRTYGVVDGQLTPKTVATNIQEFQEGNLDFLVIQIQSGNAGLNLQRTNNVIFYSIPDGNFIEYHQAKYRIRRIGQTRECNYYYLITKASIEVELMRNLKVKNMKHVDQFKY